MTEKQDYWFTFLCGVILQNVTEGLISLGYTIFAGYFLYRWFKEPFS